eukprot:TRINITY_DN11368_c0_g1_i1.p1 TRINITY_DN11368_c0_g1~~TRINITY_DN11368_c0_g1_i1.p1  ORF type:complete len:180 (-),score=36.93 TRINITY_DN11368_c0_g1_i1:4-543(-)
MQSRTLFLTSSSRRTPFVMGTSRFATVAPYQQSVFSSGRFYAQARDPAIHEENDDRETARKIETEKEKSVRGMVYPRKITYPCVLNLSKQNIGNSESSIKHAERWAEKLATNAEASVKADREEHKSVKEMQHETVVHLQQTTTSADDFLDSSAKTEQKKGGFFSSLFNSDQSRDTSSKA